MFRFFFQVLHNAQRLTQINFSSRRINLQVCGLSEQRLSVFTTICIQHAYMSLLNPLSKCFHIYLYIYIYICVCYTPDTASSIAVQLVRILGSVVVQLVRILGSHPRDPGSSPGNGIEINLKHVIYWVGSRYNLFLRDFKHVRGIVFYKCEEGQSVFKGF